MKIRIHQIEASSYTDGPGERVTVFFQGCDLACPFCQNKRLWDKAGGYETNVVDLALTLANLSRHNGGNVTISGGEPMQQPQALAELVTCLKELGVQNIIVYSGYTYDELMTPTHPAYPYLKEIFERMDVLVDGRFIREKDHDFMVFRGSSNQRVIDIPATLDEGRVITLDWDNTITIDPQGNLILPLGMARELAEMGNTERSRMCGEVSRR